MVTLPFATEDHLFIAAFEKCTLLYEEWTHEAHVHVAWMYSHRYPYKRALNEVRTRIQALNAVICTRGRGYHETITVAFLTIVSARVKKSKALSWEEFKKANPDLLTPKILLEHYELADFDTPESKIDFIPPTKKDLPSIPGE